MHPQTHHFSLAFCLLPSGSLLSLALHFLVLLENDTCPCLQKVCPTQTPSEQSSCSLFSKSAAGNVLEKAEQSDIKLPTSTGSSKKQGSSRKNIYFCFIDYAKAFDSVDHNKLWKILKEMRIPDHLNCLLRNLYAGQEATVRNGHGTTDWFQIGKGVCQGYILSPCLFYELVSSKIQFHFYVSRDRIRVWYSLVML